MNILITHIDTQQEKSLCLCGFERRSLRHVCATHNQRATVHQNKLKQTCVFIKSCYNQIPIKPKGVFIMASKTTILANTPSDHFAHLHRVMRTPALKPYITKTQGDAIAHAVDERAVFPLVISLDQRTPKGTVYVYINDAILCTIDQRGAFSWPSLADKNRVREST